MKEKMYSTPKIEIYSIMSEQQYLASSAVDVASFEDDDANYLGIW